MDNISQSTPAHQLVTKETAPLINKPRRGGILLGCEIFQLCFCFVVVIRISITMFFQLLAEMVRAERAEVEDGVHWWTISDARQAEESS